MAGDSPASSDLRETALDWNTCATSCGPQRPRRHRRPSSTSGKLTDGLTHAVVIVGEQASARLVTQTDLFAQLWRNRREGALA